MSDRIFLRGVEIYGYHGLHAEEAKLGQRFVIDVDWWLDAHPAAEHDDYEETVGYDKVFETVTKTATDHRYHLLEALGEAIASAVLARFPRVEKVRVEVHKPSAPIPGVFRDVGVEIVRVR